MAGGLQEGDDLTESHEINVTPFIDVMLVLLIIFMVAAPLSTVDIHVDLPVSSATPQPKPDKPIYITIKPDLSLNIGNDAVARQMLGQAMDLATQMDKSKRLFLRADQSEPYGELMNVLNLLRTAGYVKVALVGLEGVGNRTAQQPVTNAPSAAPSTGQGPPKAP